jgi:C-terminal processing protease CtpA/Prc
MAEVGTLGVEGESTMVSRRKLPWLLLGLAAVAKGATGAPGGGTQETAARAAQQSELGPALGFEGETSGMVLDGWGGGPTGTIFADRNAVHGGKVAARIVRDAKSKENFSSVTKVIPLNFSGGTIELRGFLRTEDVSGFAGLWMREDGQSRNLAFDNMQKRHLKGTTDWTEYSVKLPVHEDAQKLFFGFLLSGTGKAWADDLQLLVDGKPVWDLPARAKTAIEMDTQFDGGSGIAAHSLSTVQTQNLVTLGKVWGFLKYYHPAVTGGQRHWDYDLLRVLPTILGVPDRKAANAALAQWIAKLGSVARCQVCATLDEAHLYMPPDLKWIGDESSLGGELSKSLRAIRDNRKADQQFYVSLEPEVKNARFHHELSYAQMALPDFGFQLLAAYRFWNVMEYWSPDRDVIGENWDAVLAEFIPRVALAKSADDYQRELMAFIVRAHDGHANLWQSLAVRPPVGECEVAAQIRMVEGLPVVSGVHGGASSAEGLKVGDVISEIDGTPVAKLIAEWLPYYAGSNDAARMRDVGSSLTHGDCGTVKLTVRRGEQEVRLTMERIPGNRGKVPVVVPHDLPGPTFRLLSKDVAYLKLSTVREKDATSYVEQAVGTKGLMIDIRNYPSEFMVFSLGSLLLERDTPFARFTVGDLSNPGAFYWGDTDFMTPAKTHYAGKVVILVDESTMSSAEYTSMAFRAAGATVVGSTTSGADGNVSSLALPGGANTMISGIGVFYPDRTPTQRVGIVPDVVAKPTIAGIRAGRDEVAEEGVRQIVGKNMADEEIRKLARP